MGIVLDSSVLIASERAGLNSKQAFAAILRKTGNDEVALSVITLLELAHGAVRANTTERKQKRERIIQELLSAVPIHPITASIALRAGQIDGQSQASGIRIPLADLLIGATALELGYSVATENLRHFQQIPGLSIIPV
jgi:predicted nucleic acid-binding protein